MSAVTYPLEYVDTMIDFFENKIESDSAMPTICDALQKRLDAIVTLRRSDPKFNDYYPHMLELQALIYGQGNDDQKAVQSLKEAVRQVGSVGGLRSRLLKQYVASHHSSSASDAAINTREQSMGQGTATLSYASQDVVSESPQAQVQSSADDYIQQTRVGSKKHKKVLVVVASIGVVAAIGVTMYFVPAVARFPGFLLRYGEIANAKRAYSVLTNEYNSCSTSLTTERNSVDIYNTTAVGNYNNDIKHCNSLLHQEDLAADKYDNLIAVH